MEGLDFSELTNDQLLQLLEAVAQECALRAMGRAATAIISSEYQTAKLRVEAEQRLAKELQDEAARKEAQAVADRLRQEAAARARQEEDARRKVEAAKLQARRTSFRTALVHLFEGLGRPVWFSETSLAVWSRDKKLDDKRVYLNKGRESVATYYVTNQSNGMPAGVCLPSANLTGQDKRRMAQGFEEFGKEPAGTRIDIGSLLAVPDATDPAWQTFRARVLETATPSMKAVANWTDRHAQATGEDPGHDDENIPF